MSPSSPKDTPLSSEANPEYSRSYSLPKEYDPAIEEPKWQRWWTEKGVHSFKAPEPNRPTYSIDTPPPYPSGEFHVGNGLNWCYFDFVARYMRMTGHNVHFPQGWDCHGLPTEVNAEKTFKVRKNDVPPAQFVEMCRKLTEETIARMKATIIRLGTSTDWNLEYRTMDPSYYKLTQASFVRLFNAGYIYRGEHPVNWCPRCETAIAEAEVEHIQRQGSIHFIRFGTGDMELEIATTRPELLAACVAIAVHPEDKRHSHQAGKKIDVPLFRRSVPILTDQEVDQSFGSGAVMVCTFGDKMDVKWQNKYGLPLIRALAGNGRLTEEAGEFKGLKIEEARKKIIEKLTADKRLVKTESLTQSIGVCWRCKTPVEIISRPQWFMKTREMTEKVGEWADKLKWVPPFAKQRLVDWANSLDWDWVISRQRVFATPIPLWYCNTCGNILLAKETDLPVDPRRESPKSDCAKCGSNDLKGETDVLDTWMDSSISAAVHAGWPDHPSLFDRLFPADLQPNGLDIVRTWDYYLLVRSLALFGKAPFKTLLINGMVRGTDGRMMHKSYGNYVESGEVLGKFGADAFRQWSAAGGSTGYDTPFRWTEVEHGKKFLTKLWNVARFILSNLPPSTPRIKPDQLTSLDKWLLASLHKMIVDVTESLENFQFNNALESIREFTWHSLADNYLEAVKYRLLSETDGAGREAAQYCLYESLSTICKLIAPICPHISESIYQELPNDKQAESVHLNQWPESNPSLLNQTWIKEGKLVIDTIASGRRKKAEKGLALKTPLKALVIRGPKESLEVLQGNEEPILRTLKANTLQLDATVTDPGQEGSVTIEIVA